MYGMVSSQSSGRKVKSMRPQYRHDHQFQQQPIDRPLYARFFQFLKQAWYGIRDYEEERDLEEFEAQQVHIKPEAIEVLCRLTKFNRKELQIMYRGFKQDCPSGLVKEDTFKIIYAQFFPRTSDTNQYAHLIFKSFDPQRTGAITFTDFVIGLSKLIRGSLQDKLRWTFDMYDINQDGVITRDDLTQIVSAVYELMGKSMETVIDDQNQVDKVFRKLDLKMKGAITFDDFLESCLGDENLVRSLSVMDTIF